MKKIIMTKAYLINWYGYREETIPIGEFSTLFIGDNLAGKSTALDAIKYAFSGDAEFNKSSAGGSSDRTILSYVRCLTDPARDEYARSPAKYPNLYSYIVLEFQDTLIEKKFVNGVCIHANASNKTNSYWFTKDAPVDQLTYFDQQEGRKLVLSKADFFKINRIREFVSKTEAVETFMRNTGLRLRGKEVKDYQRKLRSILSYKPTVNIPGLIKASVLEEKTINMKPLLEGKANIDELKGTLSYLQVLKQELEQILKSMEDLQRIKFRNQVNDIKDDYKKLFDERRAIKLKQERWDRLEQDRSKLKEELKRVGTELDELEHKQREYDKQFSQIEGTLLLQQIQKEITDQKRELIKLQAQAAQLSELEHSIAKAINNLQSMGYEVQDEEILRNLSDNQHSNESKSHSVSSLKSYIRDEIIEQQIAQQVGQAVERKRMLAEEMAEIEKQIRDNRNHTPSYRFVPEAVSLRRELNEAFKRKGITAKARMLCEYVLDIKNKEWQNVLERLLGNSRYNIIVPLEQFDLADEIFNRRKFKNAKLVNTRLLMRQDFTPCEQSVADELVIEDQVAKAYVAYLIGGVRETQLEDVKKHHNAVSREGKISSRYSLGFLDFDKIGEYCLGADAYEANIRQGEEWLKQLQTERDEHVKLIQQLNDRKQKIRLDADIGGINFSAHTDHSSLQKSLKENQKLETQYQKALEENKQYRLLLDQISRIQQDITKHKDERNKLNKQLEDKLTAVGVAKQKLEHSQDRCEDYKKKYLENSISYPDEARTAQQEYDDFIAGKPSGKDVVTPQTKERAVNKYIEKEREIRDHQSKYNAHDTISLPLDAEAFKDYRDSLHRLEMGNMKEIENKLSIHTENYQQIFKNEFILKINTHIDEALREFKELNRTLKALKFYATFEFDVHKQKSDRDLLAIQQCAKFLLEDKDNPGEGFEYFTSIVNQEGQVEKEEAIERVNEVIVKLTEADDDMLIEKLTDYRNYLDYEILITDDMLKRAPLSKQSGYSTGAEFQIPHYLILSSALALMYNARENSIRLFFIDEPFEKMGDKNIDRMMKYFYENDFQVIFCAPDNKLNNIGRRSNVILPVISKDKSMVTIGKIEVKEITYE